MNKLMVLVLFPVTLAGCMSLPVTSFEQAGRPELRAGSIAFAGLDGNLYATVGRDEIVQLTDRSGTAGSPTVNTAYAWAGPRVVYTTQQQRPDRGVSGSFYSVVPGEAPRRLWQEPDLAPFFLYPSPDNTRVAYLGSRSDGQGLAMGSISTEGGHALLHGRGQPFYAAWSPDSQTLLTHVGSPVDGQGSAIQLQSVSDLIAGNTLESPLDVTAARFQAPAYSPDGRSIAVALREGENSTVAILSRDGSESRHVASLSGIAAFAWSPDGNRLAFLDGEIAPPRGIVGKLWIVNLNERSVNLVSERATAFFWSPDSSRIVIFEPELIGRSGRMGVLYHVVLYRVVDDGPEVIAIMRPAGAFAALIVPFFDQYHRAYTIWSPDSRLVVLNAEDNEGAPVIHLVDTRRLRNGEEFSISYSEGLGTQSARPFWAQSSPGGGLVVRDGIASRIVAFGINPFFSDDPKEFNSSESVRPENES